MAVGGREEREMVRTANCAALTRVLTKYCEVTPFDLKSDGASIGREDTRHSMYTRDIIETMNMISGVRRTGLLMLMPCPA